MSSVENSKEKPPSGRFVVRVSPLLHARLRAVSDEHGVTMNSLLTEILADGVTRYELTVKAPAAQRL